MITVPAARDGRWLRVDCPWCGHHHHHPAGEHPGAADGERLAHCWEGSYLIREVALS